MTSPIRCFRFTRVTYGIVSSGTQAIYALQKTAEKNVVSAAASRAIKRDMYVDDFMGGANTRAKAVRFLYDVVKTLGINNLLIRK